MGIFDFAENLFKSKFQKYMELHDKRIYVNGRTYLVDEKKRDEILESNRKMGLTFTRSIPAGSRELSKEEEDEYYMKLVEDFEALSNNNSQNSTVTNDTKDDIKDALKKMEINEDNISILSKKIKDNLDEIKIILTYTLSIEGYYQTENNKCAEYSYEVDEYDMDSDNFSLDDFNNYDENKNIFEGEVLIIDKLEINPKSFILLLEKFYQDDNFDDKSWYSFNQDYLGSIGAGVKESFGVQGYDGADGNIFKIDRQIERELELDRDFNLVSTLCIKESTAEDWEFEIFLVS